MSNPFWSSLLETLAAVIATTLHFLHLVSNTGIMLDVSSNLVADVTTVGDVEVFLYALTELWGLSWLRWAYETQLTKKFII